MFGGQDRPRGHIRLNESPPVVFDLAIHKLGRGEYNNYAPTHGISTYLKT